jgi:hypothetical protein
MSNNSNNNQAALKRLMPSLRELAESVHQNIYMGMVKGTGEMSVGLYRALHAKVARLMPDDDFITEALVLKYPADAKDAHLLGIVNLAIRQLVSYLEAELGETDEDDEDEHDRKAKRKLRKAMRDDDEDDEDR